MDPTNNPMQNLNSVPNGNAVPNANSGMGASAIGADMSSMMNNDGMLGSSGMGGGMQMGGGAMNTGFQAGNVGVKGEPSVTAPVGVPPVQQVGGQVSPGQMFQAGGVAAPMGALGGIPGDYSSSNSPLLGATDPITMPTPPKTPDPVEMELNAPFKAAAPVPGSIGSAISMPGDPGQVANVAFNDPAMMAPNSSMMPKKRSWSSRLGMDGGKKMDKKTLIILISIVAVVVLAIIFVVVTAL